MYKHTQFYKISALIRHFWASEGYKLSLRAQEWCGGASVCMWTDLQFGYTEDYELFKCWQQAIESWTQTTSMCNHWSWK